MQAGSRNEEHSNSGVGHALRIAAGLGTKNNSAFGICRNLQQAGASLTCVQGREHTLYTIQATRDSTDLAADFLCDVVSNQAFKPWELERNLPRMKLELATKSPAADAVEMLHQAAFRSGLGNSLYCAPHKVGSHSNAALQSFVSKHFTSGRSALLGIGVNHASLAKFGELLNLEAGSGPADVASKYSGGEVRAETGGALAYVAIAGNCAGAVSVGDCVAAMLLQVDTSLFVLINFHFLNCFRTLILICSCREPSGWAVTSSTAVGRASLPRRPQLLAVATSLCLLLDRCRSKIFKREV